MRSYLFKLAGSSLKVVEKTMDALETTKGGLMATGVLVTSTASLFFWDHQKKKENAGLMPQAKTTQDEAGVKCKV